MNQCFQDFFIGFVIVVHLVTIKKFDICLLAGWSSTLFILLVNIFDHTFNLFINNIVRKPIVDESLTSTTLSKRLTMHLSDTSSIAQHLKKHSCPTAQLRKILTDNTTILEHQNNKQKLQILEALHIRNLQPTLNRINFQTSANVLKCL